MLKRYLDQAAGKWFIIFNGPERMNLGPHTLVTVLDVFFIFRRKKVVKYNNKAEV
jgi:hypothetical protein